MIVLIADTMKHFDSEIIPKHFPLFLIRNDFLDALIKSRMKLRVFWIERHKLARHILSVILSTFMTLLPKRAIIRNEFRKIFPGGRGSFSQP